MIESILLMQRHLSAAIQLYVLLALWVGFTGVVVTWASRRTHALLRRVEFALPLRGRYLALLIAVLIWVLCTGLVLTTIDSVG